MNRARDLDRAYSAMLATLLALSITSAIAKPTILELPFFARDMSADGLTIVGRTTNEPGEPVVWTQSQGVRKLFKAKTEGTADQVSPDGSVILTWKKGAEGNWLCVKRGAAEPKPVSKFVYEMGACEIHLADNGELVLTVFDESSAKRMKPLAKVDRIVVLQKPVDEMPLTIGMSGDGKSFFGALSYGELGKGRRTRAVLWSANGTRTSLTPSENSSANLMSHSGLLAGMVDEKPVIWSNNRVVLTLPRRDKVGAIGAFHNLKGPFYRVGALGAQGTFTAFVSLPAGPTVTLTDYLAAKGLRVPGATFAMVNKVSIDGKTLLVMGTKGKSLMSWGITLP